MEKSPKSIVSPVPAIPEITLKPSLNKVYSTPISDPSIPISETSFAQIVSPP